MTRNSQEIAINYAKEDHIHESQEIEISVNDIEYNPSFNSYSGIGTLGHELDKIIDKIGEGDKKLRAEDIEYNDFEYGTYGTLQYKMRELKRKIDEVESSLDFIKIELMGKAENYHVHY